MRGKLRTTPRVTLIDGITPADAGKTEYFIGNKCS